MSLRSFHVLLLILAAASELGCAPAEPPRFQSSADVLALGEDAEDDEERELWEDLRQQIQDKLAERCGTPLRPKPLEGSGLDEARLVVGAEVFSLRCQPCHGTSGDGAGPVAEYLDPKPRDYRPGVFKFTSTPYGSKPRRSDLLYTLERGVTGTSMPSFALLAPDELEAVADYVVFLSQRGELERELVLIAQDEEELNPDYVEETVELILERWRDAQSELVMPLKPMPPMTDETIARGHELFLEHACNKCHGRNGRGGSVGGVEIGKDSWGNVAAAADLTSGMFRGGGRPIDIYRRIYSGINGTPMPSFANVFTNSPDDIWYLVHFIRDTGERRRKNLPPLEESVDEAPPVEPAITPDPVAAGGQLPAIHSLVRSETSTTATARDTFHLTDDK